MNSLCLYVDRFYLSAVKVSPDGTVRPILFAEGEDRAWLYFRVDGNEITYGLKNKAGALDNEAGFYTRIIEKLQDPHTAEYSDTKGKHKLQRLFADIVNELQAPFKGGDDFGAYIAFAPDLTPAERAAFWLMMRDDYQFDLIEGFIEPSYLLTAYAQKKQLLQTADTVLTLCAFEDALTISQFEPAPEGFAELIDSELYKGYGSDIRSRILLDLIVRDANKNLNLLKTQEEIEDEIERQAQFLPGWMKRLESIDNAGVTIPFSNISFAKAKANKTEVVLTKASIDQKSRNTIDLLLSDISRKLVRNKTVSHIFMFGDLFSNSVFAEQLSKTYRGASIVHFPKENLTGLLGMYPFIDLEGLKRKTEEKRAKALDEFAAAGAENERRRAELIEREKLEARQKAEKELRESRKKYGEMYDLAWSLLQSKELDKALVAANEMTAFITKNREAGDIETALALRDQIVSSRAVLYYSSDRAAQCLRRAKELAKASKWVEVFLKAGATLEIDPENSEAARLYSEAIERLSSDRNHENHALSPKRDIIDSRMSRERTPNNSPKIFYPDIRRYCDLTFDKADSMLKMAYIADLINSGAADPTGAGLMLDEIQIWDTSPKTRISIVELRKEIWEKTFQNGLSSAIGGEPLIRPFIPGDATGELNENRYEAFLLSVAYPHNKKAKITKYIERNPGLEGDIEIMELI